MSEVRWFRERLERGRALGAHEHERTWLLAREPGVGPRVVKVMRQPALTSAPRLVPGSAHPSWAGVWPLAEEDARSLGLEGAGWVLGSRPYLEGVTLEEFAERRRQWRALTVEIGCGLLTLHERGWPHGDLQPRNVLIDETQRVWLLDVPLFLAPDGAQGAVLGSAPTMAPELWRGEAPSLAADVYALCTLASWMCAGAYPHHATTLRGWMRAHTEVQARAPEVLEPQVRDVLDRGLSRDPDARPELLEVLDVLGRAQARSDRPLHYTPPGHAQIAEELVELLVAPGARVVCGLPGAPDGGHEELLDAVCVGLERRGREVVLMRGGGVVRRARDELMRPVERVASGGAWAPVLALIDAIAARVGAPTRPVYIPRGDQLNAFHALTEALRAVADAAQLVVLWDMLDEAGADVVDWLGHVSRQDALPFQLVAAVEHAPDWGVSRVLPQPEARDWSAWRASSLRVEVRDLARGRFEQLVQEHGATTGGMVRALNNELGLASRHTVQRGLRRGVAREDAEALEAAVSRLTEQGAYGEAARRLARWFATRVGETSDERAVVLVLLDHWLDSVQRASGSAGRVEALAEALAGTLERLAGDAEGPWRDQLGLRRLRLCALRGAYQDGLERAQAMRAAVEDGAPMEDVVQQQLAGWTAQFLLYRGQLEAAAEEAARALEGVGSPAPGTAAFDAWAHLSVMREGARALRGGREAVEALRQLAPKLSPHADPVLIARAHAYRAIGLTQRDEQDEALEAHLRALEEIEAAGLHGELPTYLLNVGVAYHKQGRFGIARDYYARGIRMSQPSTRATTRVLLLLNQGNIALELGRLEAAASLLRDARALATQHELGKQLALLASLEATLAFYEGRHEDALRQYRACLAEERAQTPYRQAELWLCCAEVLLEQGELAEARDTLTRARQLIEQHELALWRDQHDLLRARLGWMDAHAAEAIADLEKFSRALHRAMDAGKYTLVIRQSVHLWRVLQREELHERQRPLLELVERARRAVAMGLTRALRAEFFAQLPTLPHPDELDETRDVVRAARPRVVARGPSDGELERFYRMLSFNEVILHASSLHQLWHDALEIAMSLSSAERSFLLLRQEDGSFLIAASRDGRGAPIPEPHLKVSVTIAEEAARTGQTVITINAREDARFQNALSVVHQDLNSVLCVPVRDASGLLGALYLDHRFQPGVFDGELPRMMEAFGHQLALAITNVKRLRQLEVERAELQETREKLAALLEERESMVAGLQTRVEQLSDAVTRQRMEASQRTRDVFPEIAHNSPAMARLLGQVERVARSDLPLVVQGESGTGKELIARAIHHASARASGPFVPVNCGAISEALFESELFGHVKGAFTGAQRDREGLFQAAHGGTIFLDELGELPLSMQVKLLRVLQERKVRRVGATVAAPLDVRVVAATHRDLQSMVDEGGFREDLFYRLAGFILHVPPLRDRPTDIMVIADRLLARVEEEQGRRTRLSPEAAQLMNQHTWPGNVRELENTLRAASVLCDGEVITARELMPVMRARRVATQPATRAPQPRTVTTREERRGRRRKASAAEVEAALEQSGGDRAEAARLLGVSERTVYRYLARRADPS